MIPGKTDVKKLVPNDEKCNNGTKGPLTLSSIKGQQWSSINAVKLTVGLTNKLTTTLNNNCSFTDDITDDMPDGEKIEILSLKKANFYSLPHQTL